MYDPENVAFGIGTREQEIMKSQMMTAQGLGSGVNRSKMLIQRVARDLAANGGTLQNGRAADIARKLAAGGKLDAEDYKFLSNPDEVIQSVSDMTGGSLDASDVSEMMGDDRAMREDAFYNPEEATQGAADVMAEERKQMYRQGIEVAINDQKTGIYANPLGVDDQRKVLEATLAELQILNPDQLSKIRAGEATGGEGMKDAVRRALVKSGVDFKEEDLDQIVTGAAAQATRALNVATDISGETSAAAFTASINTDVQRAAEREAKVSNMTSELMREAQAYSGEGPLTGILATLQAAAEDGTGTDIPEIAKALLSGSADEKQREIYNKHKSAAGRVIADLEKTKTDAVAKGASQGDIENIEDDIAATKAFFQRLDSILGADEKKAEVKDGEAAKSSDEYGPTGGAGSGSGNLSLSGVTINIAGRPLITGASGSGSYGGKNSVPNSQIG
jgi:hypothetical protein